MNDLQSQIQRMQKAMTEKIQNADKDAARYVIMSCAKIEQTAKSIMRDSPANSAVTYGKRGHHPSYPGNPPAPDTGTLLQSITHSVEVDNKGNPTGYVGSILKNPDYPRFLEYGTSKMKPRPWLSTSIAMCHSYMANLAREIFKR